jgi:putative oxidoreductase
MKIARFLLRVTMGGLFFGHGAQKLEGWFGGHGLEATANMFEQLGLRPGRRNAIAAGAAEAGGGAALALGFATPFGAAAVIGTMLTAIKRVHLKNGPWNTNQGYEFQLILICAAALLAELGPGSLSLDHLLGTEKSGAGWGLAALAMGAAGAYGVDRLAAQSASAAAPAAEQAKTATAAAPAPEEPAATPEPAATR